MNWDQIEVKWAAMARRVRSDLPKAARAAPGFGPKEDATPVSPGDLPTAPQADAETVRVG